jgi:hypothetical protein
LTRLTWPQSLLAGAAYLAVATLIDLWFWNGEYRQFLTLVGLSVVFGFVPTRLGVKAAATFGAAVGYVLVDENVAGSPYVPHADLPGFWLAFFWLPTVLGSAAVGIARALRARRQATLPRQL